MADRESYLKLFGARLRELRLGAGFSQTVLADLVGTSHSVICHLEGGDTAPTLRTLVRLAEALECDLCDMVEAIDRARQRSWDAD